MSNFNENNDLPILSSFSVFGHTESKHTAWCSTVPDEIDRIDVEAIT